MGREARRVPLDFDWPLNQTWEGYLRPERLSEETCPDCNGRGHTPARQWVKASAHMILMLTSDLRDQQRGRPMHPYFNDYYTSSYGTRPSADIAELTAGLAGRDGDGVFGHDSSDGWQASSKIIEAAGLDPETWGVCRTCSGYGSTEKYDGQRAEADAWEWTEPPEGEGWQMWETTSEGSPMSPVFATADELAAWLADNGASLFGSNTATREAWFKIITGEDFAHVEIAPGIIAM